MRLLFVADGRSPIAINWIRYFVDQDIKVHLVSTFPCDPDLKLASFHVVPVAFSGMKGGWKHERKQGKPWRGLFWGASLVRLRTAARQWVGPFTFLKSSNQLKTIITKIQPDLVHAMRVPFEGMLAALAMPASQENKGPFLLVSVWGNDFTLHAPATPLMGYFTRRTLRRADALHTDCFRDLRLAHSWAYQEGGSAIVLPGGGGVQPEVFYPPSRTERKMRDSSPVVINPRGFRAYVRNDTFFKAIPEVIESYPEVKFICPDMASEPRAERWIQRLGIHSSVMLLPKQTRPEMAELYRKACLSVSPSEHDGTPNTLLEAMACGCFPIAGDIEPLREWIRAGENGYLIPPDDPHALAEAILNALESPQLRWQAEQQNLRLIAQKAAYLQVMDKARRFYQHLITGDSFTLN